jgi:phosphoglycolate phosphatase-like HAD superfamily hydrolase
MNQANSKIKYVVLFDFDGTLCDAASAVYHATSLVTKKYGKIFGLRQIGPEEFEKMRHMKHIEAIRYLGLNLFTMPFVAYAMRREAKKQLLECVLFPQMIQSCWASSRLIQNLTSSQF